MTSLPPADTLYRRALMRRLASAPAGGLTLVVADRGLGKSMALRLWADERRSAWHTCTPTDQDPTRFARSLADALRLRVPDLPAWLVPPDTGARPSLAPIQGVDPRDYALALAGGLDQALQTPLDLILDDVHELGSSGSTELLDVLIRTAPGMLRVVAISRLPLPFAVERLRAQGRLLEVGATDLLFSAEEVEALLELVLGDAPQQLTAALHSATGGWPVVVRLAAEHLRSIAAAERVDVVHRLLEPDGPVLDSLDALLGTEEMVHLIEPLRRLALPPWLTPALCTAVGIPDAGAVLHELTQRGLVQPIPGPTPAVASAGDGRRGAASDDAPRTRMVPVVRGLLADRHPLAPDVRDEVRGLAAKWFWSEGRYAESLTCMLDAGDDGGIDALIREHGETLLHHGEAALMLRAIASQPGPVTEPQVRLLLARAHQMVGDLEEAQRLYDAIDDGASLAAGLAWRIGSLAYQRGKLDQAVAVYRRARLDGSAPADDALVLAWLAAALFRQGEEAACADITARALEAAASAGDDVALAAAHTAAAMLAALRGDRAANDHHYLLALDAAVRAGDVAQIARIRTNRSSNAIEQGHHREGIAEATMAIDLSEGSGVTTFLGMALHNRGDAHRHLGQLEEAAADYEAARSWFERLGTTPVSYALWGLGEVAQARGQRASAVALHREAVRLAEAAGDHHVLGPALTGLAWALREEDPEESLHCATLAVELGPGTGLADALAALAAAQSALGDRDAAATTAAAALEEAGRRRDRRGMAQALELRAEADPTTTVADRWLQEAADLWRALDSPGGQARVTLQMARRSSGVRRQILATEAAALYSALGAQHEAAEAAEVGRAHDGRSTAVGVRSLGSFTVLREGVAVPVGEWGSRKARDLLKVLVARRGRTITREQVGALLWPAEGAAERRTANRLSVQLSTLRGVLDPDHVHPTDHYVVADEDTIRLDLGTVEVDVESFLSLAADGLARAAAGDGSAAMLLARAEGAYTGDFLGPEGDWAAPLRDEARATYVEVARTLAGLRAANGDADAAARMYRRVLEHDRYDEAAHLALVAVLSSSGRHGEARRCYAAYAAAMTELALEPHPFPLSGRTPRT